MKAGAESEERERLVMELFERVLAAPPDERESILAGAGARESVQRDVRELLRHESDLGDFLEAPAGDRLLGGPDEEVRLAPGDQVADFTVVGPLGEGGGGVVYDAEQREPRRRVALKMIRVRARTEGELRGFRDEAANLARLHHASIAHVYAAGVREHAGRSQPWIAMERVDGARNIVRHAADAALSRDDRLRLFLVVCDALHHAHQKGVVHRDVKPGNVLVDAEGRPKVVDFGVACGIEPDDERSSDAVGTLAYSSPEQLAGDRRGVDVRADVYGLGALLYELLTGSVPHDVDDLPISEAARVKREVPVVAPSTRAPDIPRDLDAIVLRALASDREDRYGSAAEFAADISRFLGNEPVAAYAGGSRYLLGKFVRRRRAATAAIVGIAAALIAGAAVSVWFGIENAAARELAERRSYVAEISAAAAALRVDDIAEARRRLDRAPVALREWEWRHLASRLDVSDATMQFQERELYGGSVSGDGTLLALAGADRAVGVVGVGFVALARGDGTIVREWTFPESSGIPASAVSADGRWFAYARRDGRLFFYDVGSGTESPAIDAHAAWVVAMAFSPDGSRVGTVSEDHSAALWSRADRTILRRFAHPDRVICAAFDPTGRRLATGCRDGEIRVWDAETGDLVRMLSGHEGSVEGAAFSPDGARLVSVSRDRTVRLWNLADGSVVSVGRSHTSNVRGVAFDPRGRCFVSASWDGTLRVWDAQTGAEARLLRGHGAAVTSATFAADASLLSFSMDHTVKRWDVERTDVPTCFERGRDSITALAFDSDGAQVAAIGDDGIVSVLDARTAVVTAQFNANSRVLTGAEFLGPRLLLLLDSEGDLQFWEVPSAGGAPACVRRIPHSHSSLSMSVAEAGTVVWLAVEDLLRVDLRTDAVTKLAAPFNAWQIACDGRGGLAAGSQDGDVGFLSAAGRWRVARLTKKRIWSVAFDDSGERIVAASADGTAYVLRTADLSTLFVLRGHSGVVYSAKFLPGGRRIVTTSQDRTVRLWDAGDGENVLVLHDHGYGVGRVAISPDGTRIATAGGAPGNARTSVKIWAAPPLQR